MKSTGTLRRVDPLGRIVLPKELRRTYKLDPGDGVEIFTEGDTIVLKKYEPACIFCGEVRDVSDIKGKKICANVKHFFPRYGKQNFLLAVRRFFLKPVSSFFKSMVSSFFTRYN